MKLKKETFLNDRVFAWGAIIQCVGVLSFIAIEFFYFYLLFLLAFLMFLLFDRKKLLNSAGVSAIMRPPSNLELGSFGELEITFQFSVDQSHAARTLLELKTPHLETMEFESDRFLIEHKLEKRAHQSQLSLKCHAKKLGYEKLQKLTLLNRSLFRFWTLECEVILNQGSWRIIPTRKKIPEERYIEIIRGQKIFHQGTRKQMRGQNAEQFYTVRKFQYADPIKHIDHKKTAKYQVPMTRLFESFYEHHLVIGLDLGRSLLGQLGNSSKKDYYLSAALSLAESALRSRDKVSFFGFSQKLHSQIIGAKHLNDFLPLHLGSSELDAVNVEPNYELLPEVLSRCASTRSLVVLFTDATRPSVQRSLEKIMPYIARKHLVLVATLLDEQFSLLHSLDTLDLEKMNKQQLPKQIYNYYLHGLNEEFKAQMNYQGCGYVGATESEWLNVIQRVYAHLRLSTSL